MRDLRPGDVLTASELNAVRRLLAGLGPSSPSGFLGGEQGVGASTAVDLRPGRVLARITSRGAGAAYGWHQVIDNGDGTYTDQPLIPDCPWGTPTSGPAWELSEREDVPTDGSVVVELVPGQQDRAAFYFRWDGAAATSGSGAGGEVGCDLETISFDVVTAVTCDPSGGLTVTTRRVSITGCNLSVSQGDPPAAGSGSGGGGTAFATDCQGTGESLEAHPDVSLSITDGPYSGVYALVWSATNPGAGPSGGAGWLLETTISAVPYRFFLFSAGPPGDVRWYLWVTNLNTSGTLVVIAASGACDPFSLAFPGADLGSADDVTVVIPP